MFAGISSYIWGTGNNEEPTGNTNDTPPESVPNINAVSSNRNSGKKPSKSVKKSKLPADKTVSSDSGDESDSWVLVEEPTRANTSNRIARNTSTSDTGASGGHSGKKYTNVHGICSTSGKSSSNAAGKNGGASKILSRRSTTRVLVSCNSQVPVKVAPVRKPLRRHRQVSEQSLEDFPSLANEEKPLGSGSKGDPNHLTTYAQVLATANSTSSDESSSNISICKKVDLVAVDTTVNDTSSSSSSLPSPSLVDKLRGETAILTIDTQQSQKQDNLVKKKGTGSPKSKKSRRHEATDEEWFMTPPPCFTRPNTFDMVKSPIEDMLIEQAIPATNTPSTPSSIELDSCSLSSRESSVEDRGRVNQTRDLKHDEKENVSKNKQKKQRQQEKEGGSKSSSLEKTPTPIASIDFQGEVEGKEEKTSPSSVLNKEDISSRSGVTAKLHCQEVVVLNERCKEVPTKSSTEATSPSSLRATADGAKNCKQFAGEAPADRQVRRKGEQVEREHDEEEEEDNENWQSPVVKARQRLNSKGRLALDTYTVVSRKERRKKKKTSSKSSNNNGNSNNDGNSGTGEGKNSSDWSRPSWSDASVINGASDGCSAAASFAPSLKYMLQAENRANQQKLQWTTSGNDLVRCKSGPVRRKDKFALRPHSFCLNRKTNRNF